MQAQTGNFCRPGSHTWNTLASLQSWICASLILLFAIPVAAESELRTCFGPQTFERGYGKPTGESTVFSIADYGPPFVLHVRNGDEHGKKRVSSALVWLNGRRLLGPSDFSQRETGYDLPVDMRVPATEWPANYEPPPPGQANLIVWLAGAPGGKLTIWIEGKLLSQRLIDPEGGRFEFPNGVVLNVPPNAVKQPTWIEIKDLPTLEVNAILDARAYSPVQKHMLGGFLAKPDGLTFDLPVKAIVPTRSLSTPGGLPLQAQVMLDQHQYWLAPTDLTYEAQKGTAEMTLRHFSGHAVVEAENAMGLPTDPCQQGAQRIVSEFADFSAGPGGKCQLVGDTVSVTFLDCPGQPTIQIQQSEMTPECDSNVIIRFEGQFTASGTVYSNLGCAWDETYTVSLWGSVQGNRGTAEFWGMRYQKAQVEYPLGPEGGVHCGWAEGRVELFGGVRMRLIRDFDRVFGAIRGDTVVTLEATLGTSLSGTVTYNIVAPGYYGSYSNLVSFPVTGVSNP